MKEYTIGFIVGIIITIGIVMFIGTREPTFITSDGQRWIFSGDYGLITSRNMRAFDTAAGKVYTIDNEVMNVLDFGTNTIHKTKIKNTIGLSLLKGAR
ncbi:MAG: hypothetical protein H8E71_00850 [Candidatus Marinimicrobia bacterium]|nr:hypothetical protein [Candidatus Neomarinimicrobiota bacterium]